MKIFKYILYTLFIPFWWIQKMIPRNKNIWVFGAWYGEKYADNSKVIFEYIIKNNPEIKVIWLTKNNNVFQKLKTKKNNVQFVHSLKGIWYSLIAGKVIFSNGNVDVNRLFINGAKLINIWHGAPMKKIGWDNKFANYSLIDKWIIKYVYPFIGGNRNLFVVSTAQTFSHKLSSAFDIPFEKVILSGYPRCDLLFEKELHPLVEKWDVKFNKPTKIFYLPTFRSENDNFRPFNSFGFDENEWSQYLIKSNSILISKGHYIDKYIGKKTNNKRIIHLTDKYDFELNDLLKDVDVLITDYSGVYFDFLLTNKPIILAPFDIDAYLLDTRELYFSYDDIECGLVATNWRQVLELLVSVRDRILNDEIYQQRKNLYNEFHHGDNSKRLMKEISML